MEGKSTNPNEIGTGGGGVGVERGLLNVVGFLGRGGGCGGEEGRRGEAEAWVGRPIE